MGPVELTVSDLVRSLGYYGDSIGLDLLGSDDGTWPLDVDGLLGETPAAPFARLATGTTMGHVHLRVADVGEAVGFYRDVLGLDLMAQLGDQAAFFSAGGYHHHVGANTWESAGAPAAPEGTAALRRLTIVVPGGEARTLVDPSGNVLDVIAG